MKPDLNYTSDGLFVQLYPNTDHGISAWNTMAKHFDGNAKFPCHMLPNIKAQLKSANITIRKAPKSPSVDDIDDDELLAVLDGTYEAPNNA